MARCPKCNSVLSEKDGIGSCPFCLSTFNLETLSKDSSLFKNEPLIKEEPSEVVDLDVEYEPSALPINFTCPKCHTVFEGLENKCPNCGIKLKYIAVEDIEEVEKVEEKEADVEPTLEEVWPDDDIEYADIAVIKENKIISIKRIEVDGEKYYQVTFRDESELTLSAKAMRLRGLAVKK